MIASFEEIVATYHARLDGHVRSEISIINHRRTSFPTAFLFQRLSDLVYFQGCCVMFALVRVKVTEKERGVWINRGVSWCKKSIKCCDGPLASPG